MQRPLLRSLVGGVRRLLALQVLLSIFAVALAAWTLAITTSLLRERSRLTERVIQLEETLASRNIVAPPPRPIVEAAPTYPPEVVAAADAASTGFNASEAITDLFAPPPPLARVVVHVRADADAIAARELGAELAGSSLEISVHVLPAGAARATGYYYFDGRQSAAAAQIVARFNDSARARELAQWSAQLRGTAMPAQGEFASDRLDIVLPPLPPPPAPALEPAGAAAPG